MEVREEDLLELDEADVAAQELALRALAAVEEEPLAAAADERRRERPLRRRRGSGRPEEDDVEIHGAPILLPPTSACLLLDLAVGAQYRSMTPIPAYAAQGVTARLASPGR